MYKLRPYQVTLYNEISKQYSIAVKLKEFLRLCVQAVTRSGKTVVFSYLAKLFSDAGMPGFIITHREEIFEQTFEKVTEFGINAGQIKAGQNKSFNLVQVAMVQTLANRIKKEQEIKKKLETNNVQSLIDPQWIIIDENQHAVSATWKWVIEQYPNAHIIGFTATPRRLDNKPMSEIFNTLVCGESMRWMIDNYWITDYLHLCPKSPLDKEKIKIRGKDYDKNQQKKIFKTREVAANVISYYKKFIDGLQTIVFCCDLEHAEYYKDRFDEAGYPAQVLHAKSKRRKKIIKDYKSGKYPILISIEIINEGFDVPICYAVLLLRKTKSLTVYLQQISRCLTPVFANVKSKENPNGYDIEIKEQRKQSMKEGKEKGIIIDFVGNFWLHNKLDYPHAWSLDAPTKKEREKTKILKKLCPGCKFDIPKIMAKCYLCGFDFTAEEKKIKELRVIEMSEELVNIHELSRDEAISTAGTIERIKHYKNTKKAFYAILHQAVDNQDRNIDKKISAMITGLDYDEKFRYRVWDYLKKTHGHKFTNLVKK
jgi:superfamily II DNA or RNA helicase